MNEHTLKTVPVLSIDEAAEKIRQELPGYRWSMCEAKGGFMASLTSPDLEMVKRLRGTVVVDEVTSGLLVQGWARHPGPALYRALLIAKDQIALGKAS